MKRLNLIRVWVGSLLGFIAGVASFYSVCRVPDAQCTVEWISVLWLGLSGAAAVRDVNFLINRIVVVWSRFKPRSSCFVSDYASYSKPRGGDFFMTMSRPG